MAVLPGAPAGSAARPGYRADIDGLRALAVIAVIFTHVGVTGFNGGFVGVDVFFVISGYLIHRDLVGRLAAGRLSILAFYGRRMRRTLPALYVVAAATFAASALVLMPGDLDAAARSLLGVLALVPNVVALEQTGYFDAGAATKPLLHAWSLGVEEQFYLVAPLLALGLRPLPPSRRRIVLGALFVVALAFSTILVAGAPAAAFYLMPARVFEFLIGAALAEGLLPPVRSRRLAEAIATLAMLALVACIATFSGALPHPGWPTLLPCLATAALIHVGATHRTVVGSVLSQRGPVAIGLVSYSLYLWHWPILVIARYLDLPTALPWRLGEAALLLALSVATWHFVEQPFRDPDSPWRRRAPAVLPAAAAGLAACCLVVVALAGLPGRFPPDVASVASYYAYRENRPFREGECFVTSQGGAGRFDRAACLAIVPDKANVLLIGDSHAAHLWTGLRDSWPSTNFLQATASGCKPLLDATGSSRCTALMADMFARFIPRHRLAAVAIAALWEPDDVAPLVRTLEALRREGVPVVVFGPMPRYDTPLATLLARSMLGHDRDEPARHRLPATEGLDRTIRAAVMPLATYVSTWDAMCDRGACRLFTAAGIPMQFDYHHLTAPGAAAMMATIASREPDLFGRSGRGGRGRFELSDK